MNEPLSNFDKEIMSKYKWKSKKGYNSTYYKAYYYKNKDKFTKKRSKEWYGRNQQPITCECGSIIKRYYLSKHLKTGKHKRWMNK